MTREKTVLHIDMDAFYASVEKNRKDMEGPVVVCVYSGRSEDSGAVSTCSYDARELGIHAAMPITIAKDIAENAEQEVHFVPMDKEYYRSVSDRIREEIYERYADTVEQASIDEAYLEIPEETDDAVEVAEEIQKEVGEDFHLTCSIGVAPNKLVAKIASDRQKPEGLTVVREEEVRGFMYGLEIEDIHGIGEITREKLESLGINSVEELANAENALLVEEFGENFGPTLKEKARGKDSSEVKPQEQKQITRITTLGENSSIPRYIEKYFPELAQEIVPKADEKGVGFRKISVIVIDDEIQMHTRSTTLKSHVNDKKIIIQEGEKLLEEFLENFSGQVRRIGLRISDLKEIEDQSSLGDF
ncbi:DNA polymerase IV [Candidatus Nanohalobium constans]|uniref:DNA polymerase IV n=1 Tax=Candidatus Nanohalobium constans TaxID=2565781 RepID=A0A5Q0UFL5_9ARCH|nr:DNA polymerase IV [Candidatus Nanohalobium constans]QGA80377.1 DNA polymerase IV [Candidatus Nanohalobium constans]